jgi:hypothetical protein
MKCHLIPYSLFFCSLFAIGQFAFARDLTKTLGGREVDKNWLVCSENVECTSVLGGCQYWQPVNAKYAESMKAAIFTPCKKTVDPGPQPVTRCVDHVCAAVSETQENLIHGSGTIQKAKPWDAVVGPFYEFRFNPPLQNVHRDQANDEPDKEVDHWAICGNEQQLEDKIGKRWEVSAIPTPSYAETLCLKIVNLKPQSDHAGGK